MRNRHCSLNERQSNKPNTTIYSLVVNFEECLLQKLSSYRIIAFKFIIYKNNKIQFKAFLTCAIRINWCSVYFSKDLSMIS